MANDWTYDMTKTKINHHLSDFIVKNWESINRDGYRSGMVYYYDEIKNDILFERTEKLVAKRKGYTQDTENFFSQEIEGNFNSTNEYKRIKSIILLLMTMGARNPLRSDFNKFSLDSDIKRIDWDAMTSALYQKYTFFFIKSKYPFYLNTNGIVYLPPMSTGLFTYLEDYPIGLPINTFEMLCFCKKQNKDSIDNYAKQYSMILHQSSVGIHGNIIIPIDYKHLIKTPKIFPDEYKLEIINHIKTCRDNCKTIPELYEQINEKLREMGRAAEDYLRTRQII